MSGLLDFWISVRRTVTIWVVVTALAVMVGVFLCGRAQAATTTEARFGDRDGTTFGLGVDKAINDRASAGALLELGEDDAASIMGRTVRVWNVKCVQFVLGVDAGFAIEPETDPALVDVTPGKAHAFTATVDTKQESGFAVGAVAGVRGVFKANRPGFGWILEVTARDGPVNDGVGFTAGLRFK